MKPTQLKKSGAKCRKCGSTLAWMTKAPTPRAPWLCIDEKQCARRRKKRAAAPLPSEGIDK